MKKASVLVLSFIFLFNILLSPNCASLTQEKIQGEKTQRIPVTSSPIGATVFVNGVEQGRTPIEIMLVRRQRGQVIRIESPGYNPFEIRMRRGLPAGPALGNVLSGGIAGYGIGLALHYLEGVGGQSPWAVYLIPMSAAIGSLFLVDFAVGQGHAFKPKELTVTLTKADGTARVDAMLIDSDDLRNVKWIRVRKD